MCSVYSYRDISFISFYMIDTIVIKKMNRASKLKVN